MDELDGPNGEHHCTVGVYSGTIVRTGDESIDVDPRTVAVYFCTKWEAHTDVANSMMEDDLPLVIMQPVAVYGLYDKLYGSLRAGFR